MHARCRHARYGSPLSFCDLIPADGIDSLATDEHIAPGRLGTPAESASAIARGFFLETYHQARSLRNSEFTDTFVQDNHSRSVKGNAARAPLSIAACAGQALPRDRGRSPGRRRGHSRRLADISENGPACCFRRKRRIRFYIPPGFAHGFVALTDTVQFLYKCSDFYDPTDEHGILWNDPGLATSPGASPIPLISEKDAKYSTLAEMPREFLPRLSRRNETHDPADRKEWPSRPGTANCCRASAT